MRKADGEDAGGGLNEVSEVNEAESLLLPPTFGLLARRNH